MSVQIPDSHKDLLDNAVYVTVATVMPDGQPQLSIVWCSTDGNDVLVNTALGRQKDKNLRARPQATVLAIDPQNPMRYIEVRGSVTLIEEGAVAHIDQLANLYVGATSYYGGLQPAELAEQETRVIARITPTKIVTLG